MITINETKPGQIITFYSYKGGTGRSMAVANCAYWLVKTFPVLTRRVLVMDWDLEAPGLHRYFAETAERTENQERPGIINYFDTIQDRLRADPQLYEKLEREDGWRVLGEEFPLHEHLIPDVIAGVDFVKAGRYDAGYAELISRFNWVDFYQEYGAVFPAFRDFLLRSYEFCLIDSRTGFNDVSGICTMLLPEKLVTVFTPNRQNVSGVLDLAGRAAEYRLSSDDERTLSVFPLPSRIENAEQELRQVWQKDYQQAFEATLKSIYKIDVCDLTNYFDDVQLPHVSFYSYGEEIALLKEERSGALSLSRGYELFFEKLVGLKFAWDKKDDLTVVPAPVEMEIHTDVSKIPSIEYADSNVFLRDSRKSYDSDIYISYAHIDDQALLSGQDGWVSTFQKVLGTRLAQLLGEEPRVWRDPKLRGNDVFEDVLVHRLAQTNIFLAIVTPRYVNSDWCAQELREFYRQADKGEGGGIKNRARIFKILKTPIDEDQQPPELKGLLGYKFYETDAMTGRPREFIPDRTGGDTRFWQRLDDLAYDITELLRSQHRIGEGLPAKDAMFSPAGVYLAETTPDLDSERDTIRRELEQRGYEVVPDRHLPKNASAFRDAVSACLERCQLSIHPVGETYGSVPDGEDRSAVEIQNELAAELSARINFSRVIWMPLGLEPRDARQATFIDSLRSESKLQSGADVLDSSLEELKTFVQRKLLTRASVTPLAPAAGLDSLLATDATPRIYLICDKQDYEAIAPLRDYFFDQGFEVTLPLLEGDEAEVREDHKEMLLLCDAVLIYYGTASEGWLRTKLRDLQKIAGYGRTKPSLAKAIYVGAPETSSKDSLRTLEALVIRNFGTFSPDSLQPFLHVLNKSKQSNT